MTLMLKRMFAFSFIQLVLLICSIAITASTRKQGMVKLDVPYEPTHPQVVEAMLRMAQVSRNDVVYDLGCGDGRIVIMAAKKFGARGVGVDIDPQRIKEANEGAQKADVTSLVQFRVQDLMDIDISDATVVTLYLLPSINLRVRPKLFRELKPGTRVVSHAFDMGDWEPDRTLCHPKARRGFLYLWIIPARVGGIWYWTSSIHGRIHRFTLCLQQQFQAIEGTIAVDGGSNTRITNASLLGHRISFSTSLIIDGKPINVAYRGQVRGNMINGFQYVGTPPHMKQHRWVAKRQSVRLMGTWLITSQPRICGVNASLLITGNPPALRAKYIAGRKALPVSDFYAWGASVRFTVPLRIGNKVIPVTYEGFTRGDHMTGILSSHRWAHQFSWKAVRINSQRNE